MAANTSGQWGPLLDWPLIGIHSIVTQDGKVLSFGTDINGVQGSTMYHDLWDPVTGEHHLLDHHTMTPTDIFCAAAVIIPGTNYVMIAGGDARPLGSTNTGVNDVNLFDVVTHEIRPATTGEMNVARWYPTTISLASGQMVIFGGTNQAGQGQGTPEIYTPGEGWRSLTGATDADMAASSFYPKAWVGPSGEIFYFVNGGGTNATVELMALDPSGNGSLREVAKLPFNMAWDSPSIMFDTGKMLVNDTGAGLWTIDINGAAPVITKVATMSQERNYANMTVLADGKVLINGGTGRDNLEAYADKTATIWDPATKALTYTVDEINPRLYHSTSVLLADGSVLSMGGGAAGGAEHNFLDAQIYKPGYLFDTNSNPATRPVVSGAPASVEPGETFRLTVDDASAIAKLNFVKNGATTHNFNVDARQMQLSFTVIDSNTIEVKVPDNAHEVTAGSWMLFAWNNKGVPAIAPIIAVEPTIELYDGIGDLKADYFNIPTTVTGLDQIDFNGTPIHAELLTKIDTNTTGSFYAGGPADNFAVRYNGKISIETAGSHTFYLTSDDGSQLYIDGVLVVNNNAVQASTQKTATINLAAGEHSIEVRYFEKGEAAVLDLDWSGPGFPRKQMTFDGVVDNLLVNGSLETAGATGNLGSAALPGWTGANNVELWLTGLNGVAARAGRTFVEVDGGTGALSQTVKTVAGSPYTLSFDLAGRPGFVASSKLDVVVNGTIIGTITPADSNWHRYSFTFNGTANDTVAFRPVAGDTDTVGALIDAVLLTGARPGTEEDHDHSGNHIVGTAGNDFLDGTDGNDHIAGGDGNDTLIGGKGNDYLDGQGGEYNQVDYDGAAGDNVFTRNADGTVKVTSELYGTDTLVNIDGIWFRGAAKWATVDSLITGGTVDPGQHLMGTAANDFLEGGSGDDHIMGLAGNDTLYGGRGNDELDGGAGDYNQADYDGAASDYVFTRNADGTVTVTNATYGTDTLTEIDGIWFRGEGKWYSIGALTQTGGGSGSTINGTAGNDYLVGTAGNDTILGGDGNDTLVGGAGNDILNGEGGTYNQVDYSGKAADYTFTRNADGTIKVESLAEGSDSLSNINGIWFSGESKWYAINDLVNTAPGTVNIITATTAGGWLDGTAGNDEFIGNTGNDVFHGGKGNDIYHGGGGSYDQVDLDGKKADYTFVANQDGSVTASHSVYGIDTFHDIDGVWFYEDATWSAVSGLIG